MNIRPMTPSFKGNLTFKKEVTKKDLGGNEYIHREIFELNPNKITSLYEENFNNKEQPTTIICDDTNTKYKFDLPMYSVKHYIQDALSATQNKTVGIPNFIERV